MKLKYNFDDDDIDKEIEVAKIRKEIKRVKNELKGHLNAPYTRNELYQFKYYLAVASIIDFLDERFKLTTRSIINLVANDSSLKKVKQILEYFPVPLAPETKEDEVKRLEEDELILFGENEVTLLGDKRRQLLKELTTKKSKLLDTWTILDEVYTDLNVSIEEKIKAIQYEMGCEWEQENSLFKANVLNVVEEYFEKVEALLEYSLNDARDKGRLPEFAYYTALKWAFKKERGLSFTNYMILLNMPIGESFPIKELYTCLKKISVIVLQNGNVSASLNYSSGVSVGKLLNWAITELAKFQYDIEEL